MMIDIDSNSIAEESTKARIFLQVILLLQIDLSIEQHLDFTSLNSLISFKTHANKGL